jgi:Zn-dependent peptidase ImmA (M78 family)/DNA-binding XRE family transcriptional regulator
MGRIYRAVINPELLVWARLSAKMEMQDAASKIHVSPEKLKAWESGESAPTINQLRKVASVYRQSFAAFYLPTPPEVFEPPTHDYRRLPDERTKVVSPDLVFDVRLAVERREIFLELLGEMNEAPTEFTAAIQPTFDPEVAASGMREILGVSVEQQRQWQDPRVGFNSWREAFEASGVLVFQSSGIPLSEMRGYSFAVFPLPVVVVNWKDSYAGRTFSMFHELTHVMLRSSGLCDLETDSRHTTEDERTEVFCNHVAGAALVPKGEFLNEPLLRDRRGPEWDDEVLRKLSTDYAVSREVILRRLLVLGLTTDAYYREKRDEYLQEYRLRLKSVGFLHPATDALSAAGKAFTRLVLEAFHSGRITSSDVSDYMGVRAKHFSKLEMDAVLG